MNCRVQGVYKNLRYKVLIIDKERYILDMGQPFWKILFPFFYWILPNTVYKVDDHEVIEKIKAPNVKQKTTGGEGLLAGAIGVVLANLIQPLVNYLDVESSMLVNSIIVAIAFLLVLSVSYYINIRSKNKLSKVVNLGQYSKQRVWIRPPSKRIFYYILFSYFFALASIILFWGGFIQLANGIILIGGMMFLFFLFFLSTITIPMGDTTAKYKNDKEATG